MDALEEETTLGVRCCSVIATTSNAARRVPTFTAGCLPVVPSSWATGAFRAAIDMAAAPQRGANLSFATEGEGSGVVEKKAVTTY